MEGAVGIDATTEMPGEGHPREWPEVIRMDDDTVARVKAKWSDLGLGPYPEKKSTFWP